MNESERERQARLTQEGSKALEWLNNHWKAPHTCPICTEQQWGIGTVVEMREFHGGNIVIGAGTGVLPVTPVSCQTCGYTFFMSAIRSGAVENGQADG